MNQYLKKAFCHQTHGCACWGLGLWGYNILFLFFPLSVAGRIKYIHDDENMRLCYIFFACNYIFNVSK